MIYTFLKHFQAACLLVGIYISLLLLRWIAVSTTYRELITADYIFNSEQRHRCLYFYSRAPINLLFSAHSKLMLLFKRPLVSKEGLIVTNQLNNQQQKWTNVHLENVCAFLTFPLQICLFDLCCIKHLTPLGQCAKNSHHKVWAPILCYPK